MKAPDHFEDRLTPAEQGLHEHLEVLRSAPPAPSTDLVPRVLAAARWQHVIRRPLLILAHFAAAVSDGLRLIFGSPGRRS
jgi:hypothetical protein